MSLMSKTDFRKVWYAVLPLFVSYLPLGLASGILLQSVHFNPGFQTFLISVLVFSGGGQFLVVALLATQSSVSTILMMVFFLELRYALWGQPCHAILSMKVTGS